MSYFGCFRRFNWHSFSSFLLSMPPFPSGVRFPYFLVCFLVTCTLSHIRFVGLTHSNSTIYRTYSALFINWFAGRKFADAAFPISRGYHHFLTLLFDKPLTISINSFCSASEAITTFAKVCTSSAIFIGRIVCISITEIQVQDRPLKLKKSVIMDETQYQGKFLLSSFVKQSYNPCYSELSYMIDILIYSLTMDSQVKSHTTKLSGSVQADTFRLEADLKSHHLTIVLKDLIRWKIYAKKYTKDDIGKEINLKVQLEDIFYAVTCSDDSQAKDKKPIFYTYKFGDIINSRSSQLKVEENGKVTVVNTIFHQRAGNMVQKKETSILNLQVLADIKEADKIEMVKQNLKRQMELKYEKQIKNQHTENQRMKEQMQKMQKEIELLKKGEKKQEVKAKSSKNFTIQAKTLTGTIHNILVSANSTIQNIKQLISDKDGAPPDQLRLIYAGMQMQDGRMLSDYNIYSEATIHIVKRLRGSIGIFDVYLNSPCRRFLSEKINQQSSQDYKQIEKMVSLLKGDMNSQFKMFQLTEIQCGKLKQLIMLSESKYQQKLNQSAPEQWIEDIKISLVRTRLVELIGEELCQKLQRLFSDQYDEIVVRRCKAHGKMINFHTDVSQKTMQVALNDETEYEGGRLLFVNKGNLSAPERMTGTVTIHDNTIVHGVTLLESGVRYGLFFLKK